MESNSNQNNVCEQYFINLLNRLINTVVSNTGEMMFNRNSPSTDSGFTTDNTIQGQSGNSLNDNSSVTSYAFYGVFLAIGLMPLMMNNAV